MAESSADLQQLITCAGRRGFTNYEVRRRSNRKDRNEDNRLPQHRRLSFRRNSLEPQCLTFAETMPGQNMHLKPNYRERHTIAANAVSEHRREGRDWRHYHHRKGPCLNGPRRILYGTGPGRTNASGPDASGPIDVVTLFCARRLLGRRRRNTEQDRVVPAETCSCFADAVGRGRSLTNRKPLLASRVTGTVNSKNNLVAKSEG